MQTTGDVQPADDIHPDTIAGYRIIRLLGEGGMGRVYLAREQHPPRDVALKLIRSLQPQALLRFRREAELLAALEHPGIARLYAAGETDLGGLRLPWLAIEHVDGNDLVTHADAHALDLPARVRLLIAVCRAVQHAHGRGVIHRDLKPGNILVDADGSPRVLDFGIARLHDDQDGMTAAGQVLGTLPYMAPELIEHGGRGDVAGDVYALGVIAYELIARQLPHPKLSTSTLFEALDIVRRETPRPLAALVPAARGDLECVVMKALDADPQRRYASAAEFAADLDRVLDHRPVEARPPSAGYLLGRLVRRNRALGAAAAIVLLAVVGASVVSVRFALAERDARVLADLRAAEAAAINRFLTGMLGAADPTIARGRQITVAEVIAQAERELDAATPPAPVLRAVLGSLADLRQLLGQFEPALAAVDRALATEPGTLPAPQHVDLLRRRASLLTELRRFDEARAAIASARRLPRAEIEPVQALALQLTATRIDQDDARRDPAEAGYRALLADQMLVGDDPERVRIREVARSNLATLLRERGALDESERFLRELLHERHTRYGERDPRTLSARYSLAQLAIARGEHADAAVALAEIHALQGEVLGPRHPSTLTTLQAWANAEAVNNRLDVAERLSREAIDGFEATLGPTDPQTLVSMNALAYVLEQRGDLAVAEALYRQVLERSLRGGREHPETLGTRSNLAMLLMDGGKFDEAIREFETLLAAAGTVVGQQHPYYAIFSSNFGLCLTRAGDPSRALTLLEPARERLLGVFGSDHPRTRAATERLVDAYRRLHRHADAEALMGAP